MPEKGKAMAGEMALGLKAYSALAKDTNLGVHHQGWFSLLR